MVNEIDIYMRRVAELRERVAELEAALRPFADWWFAGVFVGPTELHQQLGIAGMRAHQTLAEAPDAGERREG